MTPHKIKDNQAPKIDASWQKKIITPKNDTSWDKNNQSPKIAAIWRQKIRAPHDMIPLEIKNHRSSEIAAICEQTFNYP